MKKFQNHILFVILHHFILLDGAMCEDSLAQVKYSATHTKYKDISIQK